jgi:hypothetical protein
MAELMVGARVSVKLPKGQKQGHVQQVRGGFYQCRFDDGSSAWVDARDVLPEGAGAPSASLPPAAMYSQPPARAYSQPPARAYSQPPPSLAAQPSPGTFVPSAYGVSTVDAAAAPAPYQEVNCVSCGRPGADWFPQQAAPLHRACAGLGPDEVPLLWLVALYLLVVPFGCCGALGASVPYYLLRKEYPLRAKAINRHIWFAFAGSLVFHVLVALLRAASK